jgi:Zn-dependent protease with chaperone function
MSFQGSTPIEQLEAGLAAVKRRDYKTAIPLLKGAIALLPQNSEPQVKAQMALVKAYKNTQATQSAIELLQDLKTHSNPQVTTWANTTLQDLQQITPTPLTPTASKPRRRAPGVTSQHHNSGETTLAQPEPYTSPPPQPKQPKAAPAAKTWTPLPAIPPAKLQQAQIAAILAFFLIPYAIHGFWFLINYFWFRLATSTFGWRMTIVSYKPSFPGPFQFILNAIVNNFNWPKPFAWLGLGLDLLLLGSILWIVAPWILQIALQKLFGLKKLNGQALSHYSEPAYRLLQRGTQQTPMPDLGLLPTEIPLIFSYGSQLPKFPFTRSPQIVVSQGLINSLTPEELATLYGAELSHITNRSAAILSWIVAFLQIPYGLYWGFASLGDRLLLLAQSAVPWQAWGLTFVAYLLAFASSLNYAIFWTLRWSGLWLSRERQHQGDRTATNLTGDPNALTRALLKYIQATSHTIQTQGQTHPLLESLELLLPVSYRAALSLGSSSIAPEALLNWDMTNPHRHWLNFNNANNLLGDRLLRLTQYSHNWNLASELQLTPTRSTPTPKRILLQGAPYWGALFGYSLATLCWLIAWAGHWLKLPQLAWLGSDFKLFIGMPLVGWGLGSILRFNQFFPDIPMSWFRSSSQEADTTINDLLEDPLALPLDAPRSVIHGQLLGRKGIANWLGQDLMIEGRDRQLLKLHYCTPMGLLGNWARSVNRPSDLVGQTVSVVGWLRRGATPWFDLEQLRTSAGRTNRGSHQLYSTIISMLFILFGILYCGLSKDF